MPLCQRLKSVPTPGHFQLQMGKDKLSTCAYWVDA